MANSRKPRKRYNPDKHKLHVPMTAATRNPLALDLHLTVESLVSNPTEETGSRLARILMAMANAINYQSPVRIADRADDDAVAVKGALAALQAIEDRFDRLGKYGLNGDEIAALRKAAGGLDESLARIPFNVLQQSIVAANRIAA
jgi:hypothetical protein